jgi:hypothetical protein
MPTEHTPDPIAAAAALSPDDRLLLELLFHESAPPIATIERVASAVARARAVVTPHPLPAAGDCLRGSRRPGYLLVRLNVPPG